MVGYLYIINNMKMYGWDAFKIGSTVDLKKKLEGYNSNINSTGEFFEQGYIICKDVELIEKKVLEDLNFFRWAQNPDFFCCHIGFINLAILRNSKNLILENHLKYTYFCTPQGPKYEAFFNKLEKFALEKKINPPQKPENNCIGGSFCGCTSYPGKSYQGHFKNWNRILNWVEVNSYKQELNKFIIALNKEDTVFHNNPYPNDQGID